MKKLRSGCLIVQVAQKVSVQQPAQAVYICQLPGQSDSSSLHELLQRSHLIIRTFNHEWRRVGWESQRSGSHCSWAHVSERDNQKSKTHTMVLTFNTSHLPRSIKAGCYLNIAVEQYTPNPLRYFNCQKYGHHQTKCRHGEVCAKCGLAAHGSDPCSRGPHCVNCQRDHPAFFTLAYHGWAKSRKPHVSLPISPTMQPQDQVSLPYLDHRQKGQASTVMALPNF